MFWDYQTEILSIIFTILVTGGATFLFYPAILVYYHEDIDHTTTIIQNQTKSGDKNNKSNENKEEDVLFSLVIPAYNEEDRLTVMLEECYEYFARPTCPALDNLQLAYQKANSNATKDTIILVEWIVVNDGSSDKTCQVFEHYVAKIQKESQQSNNAAHKNRHFLFKLVSLNKNEGKGAAVHVGMTEATGYFRLMVDADGATTFGKGLEAVTQELLQHHDNNTTTGGGASTTQNDSSTIIPSVIIFGSRAGEGGAQRTALRAFLMHSFLWLRSCVVGTPVSLRDTQCGFKLFDKTSAMQLFSNLHLRRWAFDIELVYVALSMGMLIQEVTVPWHEVDGSKLNTGFLALVWVSIGMLRDMMCVRACYVLGIWNIRPHGPAPPQP